jgi:hypothetical protein
VLGIYRCTGTVHHELLAPLDEIAQRQPWNAGSHHRKFLLSNGRYVAEDGSLGEGGIVFWGEWEAPSIKHK